MGRWRARCWGRTSPSARRSGAGWTNAKGHEHPRSWLDKSYWMELGGRPWRGRGYVSEGGEWGRRGRAGEEIPLLGGGFEV